MALHAQMIMLAVIRVRVLRATQEQIVNIVCMKEIERAYVISLFFK